MQSSTSQSAASKALPVLYGAVDLLDRERHKALRVRAAPDYQMAAGQPVIPLILAEFDEAARSAPVVFVRAGSAFACVMVTGLRNGSNSLLGREGWRRGAYVPAYLRRYPFILVDTARGRRIGIDPGANQLSELDGEPLFEDGKEGAVIERIRTFCNAYSQGWEATQPFLAALSEADLLVPAVTTLADPGGEPLRVDGFHMVDPERLAALAPETLAEWQRKGWLGAIHAHRASLKRWADLRNAA